VVEESRKRKKNKRKKKEKKLGSFISIFLFVLFICFMFWGDLYLMDFVGIIHMIFPRIIVITNLIRKNSDHFFYYNNFWDLSIVF